MSIGADLLKKLAAHPNAENLMVFCDWYTEQLDSISMEWRSRLFYLEYRFEYRFDAVGTEPYWKLWWERKKITDGVRPGDIAPRYLYLLCRALHNYPAATALQAEEHIQKLLSPQPDSSAMEYLVENDIPF